MTLVRRQVSICGSAKPAETDGPGYRNPVWTGGNLSVLPAEQLSGTGQPLLKMTQCSSARTVHHSSLTKYAKPHESMLTRPGNLV